MSAAYVAVMVGEALWVTASDNPDVHADEAYPLYGHVEADRWLESRGWALDESGWARTGGFRRAVWERQVAR